MNPSNDQVIDQKETDTNNGEIIESSWEMIMDDEDKISGNRHRKRKSLKKFIIALFPFLGWLPFCFKYLLTDILAGINVGLYQIVQGMAYSTMAHYPVSHLLHTNIISSIFYTMFGSNRRFSYGVFSLVSILYIGIILERVKSMDPKNFCPENIITLTTFVIGILSALIGILRLGSLIRFMPYEVLAGFRSAVYVLVITICLSLMGNYSAIGIGEANHILIIVELYRNQLYNNDLKQKINWDCWIISIGCIVILSLHRSIIYYWNRFFNYRRLWLKEILRRIPIDFVLIIISIITSRFVDLKNKYKIEPIESIYFGNETLIDLTKSFKFKFPQFQQYFKSVWFECIICTILFLMYTHSLALDYNISDTEKIIVSKKIEDQQKTKNRKQQLNPKRMDFFRWGWKTYNTNNELITKGFIDCISSFFKCVPCGVSRTRSDRMRNVGATFQICGLVASIVTLAVWLTMKKYLVDIPKCIIASIVAFDSLVALFHELAQLPNFYRASFVDLLVWLVTFSSFITLNIDLSLYCALALSFVIYYFQNYSSLKFRMEKALITKTNSVVVVPEFIHDHTNFESNNQEDDMNDDNSNSLRNIPPSILKTIKIYKMDRKYLSVANLDHFVLGVCRKISDSIKQKTVFNRLIFDCRSLVYMDWPSIRLVKATVMRTIQVMESWTPIISNPFILVNEQNCQKQINNNDEQQQNRQQVQDDQQVLVVVFVFPTQMVKIIHNAGAFNINFYHSLHRSLHIDLKGAIQTVVSLPNRNSFSNSYENVKASPKISQRNDQLVQSPEEITKSSIVEPKPNKNKDKKSKKSKKSQKIVMDLENQEVRKNDEPISQPMNPPSVLPLSFKQQNPEQFVSQSFPVSSSTDPIEMYVISQPSTSKPYPTLKIISQESLKGPKDNDMELTSLKRKQNLRINESMVHKLSKSIAQPPPPPPPPPPPLPMPAARNFKSKTVTAKSAKQLPEFKKDIQINEWKSDLDNQHENGSTPSVLKNFDFRKHLENIFGSQSSLANSTTTVSTRISSSDPNLEIEKNDQDHLKISSIESKSENDKEFIE